MSTPNWVKKYLRMKPEMQKIFDALDEYREFCAKQGYVFDEADLGNENSPYSDFQRTKRGKYPRDNWGYLIKHGDSVRPPYVNNRTYNERPSYNNNRF